eukprot:6861889-Prymnesium_polylepis.2
MRDTNVACQNQANESTCVRPREKSTMRIACRNHILQCATKLVVCCKIASGRQAVEDEKGATIHDGGGVERTNVKPSCTEEEARRTLVVCFPNRIGIRGVASPARNSSIDETNRKPGRPGAGGGSGGDGGRGGDEGGVGKAANKVPQSAAKGCSGVWRSPQVPSLHTARVRVHVLAIDTPPARTHAQARQVVADADRVSLEPRRRAWLVVHRRRLHVERAAQLVGERVHLPNGHARGTHADITSKQPSCRCALRAPRRAQTANGLSTAKHTRVHAHTHTPARHRQCGRGWSCWRRRTRSRWQPCRRRSTWRRGSCPATRRGRAGTGRASQIPPQMQSRPSLDLLEHFVSPPACVHPLMVPQGDYDLPQPGQEGCGDRHMCHRSGKDSSGT